MRGTLQHRFKNLTFWAAPKCVVGLATPLAWLHLCQVIFHKKDGSIFVDFPHFRERDGIATVVRLEPGGSPKRTIRLLEEGKVTSHLVKYAHHSDGRVHFSQDGKVRTEIKRQANFPLNGPIGRVFDLLAFRPAAGFLPLDHLTMKKGRPYLVFDYKNQIPAAVRIRASWRRKVDVSNWSRPPKTPLGPRAKVESAVNGSTSSVFFFGQPPSYPLQDHVLAIFCNEVTPPSGLVGSTLLFFCGADADEVAQPGDAAPPSEYLVAMYPVTDRGELERLVGTIDYNPQGEGAV